MSPTSCVFEVVRAAGIRGFCTELSVLAFAGLTCGVLTCGGLLSTHAMETVRCEATSPDPSDSAVQAASMPDEASPFEVRDIDPAVGRVCYALALADVDGDGDDDIVAITENRVIWYSQPEWTPHVILQDQTPADNVCIAPHDIDGDGIIDFAIGAGWTKSGTVHWIRRSPDPTALWEVHSVGEETSVHRMRWADVLNSGRPQLVVSPLNASQGNGVRLLAFEVPLHPTKERWAATVLNSELNRMHNHWHTDLDADGVIDTITASREGLTWIRREATEWTSVRLSEGITGSEDANQNGAGEVRIGRLAGGRRFLAAVEPMHGDHLTVCLEPEQPGALWERHVVAAGFRRGHALGIADFDGDGSDDIAFGHSDTPETFGVLVFLSDGKGTEWRKLVVDEGGMAAEDLVVGDLNGDGRPDIVAGGRGTHNVRLYINRIR